LSHGVLFKSAGFTNNSKENKNSNKISGIQIKAKGKDLVIQNFFAGE